LTSFSALQVRSFERFSLTLPETKYNFLGIVLSGASAPSPGVTSEAAAVKVLQTPGTHARISIEWRPSKLLCKRFNVPDPFFGRAETFQREQSSSNRMSKTMDTAALLGISSSHATSAAVDVTALERLAAALKQTADEDKSKQTASRQAQPEVSKAIPNEKMAVLPEPASGDNAEPLPRAPDDLFASIFGLDDDINEDVELPPAVVSVATTLAVEPTVAPISNDELAELYSSMTKGSGPVTSSLARTRKFASSWDAAPQTTAGSTGLLARRPAEVPAAPVPSQGSQSDATASASKFLKAMSSDAFDGFLPSMDELQRDNGASFKLLKSRDSASQAEQLPSWRSKLVPACEQLSDASKDIKSKVDIKMQALAAAREALVSSSVAAPSQEPGIGIPDVMHGPSLPPPGSSWAGPSWQPKPVSWGSAPVRGSQSSMFAANATAQPSNRDCVQTSDSRGDTHHNRVSNASHSSITSDERSHKHRHRHSNSDSDRKSKNCSPGAENSADRPRHHSHHRSASDRRDDHERDKSKDGHRHRHHRSDDRSGGGRE